MIDIDLKSSNSLWIEIRRFSIYLAVRIPFIVFWFGLFTQFRLNYISAHGFLCPETFYRRVVMVWPFWSYPNELIHRYSEGSHWGEIIRFGIGHIFIVLLLPTPNSFPTKISWTDGNLKKIKSRDLLSYRPV